MFRIFLGVVLSSNLVFSIPRFAVKNGTTCATCHVSPTGAGLRNHYGLTIVSMDELPIQWGRKFTDETYTGTVGGHLQAGADLRLQLLIHSEGDTVRKAAFFPMQGDVYGYLTVSRAIHVYAKLDLIRGYPEFWTMLEFFSGDGYFKIGRKIATYGLRLDDHTSFVRGGNLSLRHTKSDGEDFSKEGMPFSPRVQMPGIFEMGLTLRDLFLTASISNPYVFGGETGFQSFQGLSDKNLTARMEYSRSLGPLSGLAGASVMKEKDLQMAGAFGGISVDRFTVLGEVDVAKNWVDGGITSLASYCEFIVEPIQGVNLVGKFDFFDEDMDLLGNDLTRYTVGLEIFPMAFFEVRAQVRLTRTSQGMDQPAPEYLVQSHTWF